MPRIISRLVVYCRVRLDRARRNGEFRINIYFTWRKLVFIRSDNFYENICPSIGVFISRCWSKISAQGVLTCTYDIYYECPIFRFYFGVVEVIFGAIVNNKFLWLFRENTTLTIYRIFVLRTSGLGVSPTGGGARFEFWSQEISQYLLSKH
mgnify:FL=1